MKLVRDAIVDAWRCKHRLHCCGGWDVPLRAGEGEPIRVHLREGWPERDELEESALEVLPLRRDSGACVLLEGHLCGYRARFGVETQPRACRTFPYMSVGTPGHRLVGLDFTCPTALGLLAAAGGVDTVADEAEPPTPFGAELADPALPCVDLWGRPMSQTAFWAAHRAAVDAFVMADGDALSRMLAVAAAMGGPAMSVAPVSPGWTGALGPVMLGLLSSGGEPVRAAELLAASDPGREEDQVPVPADADAFFARYLEHRLMVPAALGYGLHLGRMIGVALIAAARVALDVRRGVPVAVAVQRADVFLFHRRGARRLLGEGVGDVDWRTPLVIVTALAGGG